MLITAPVLRIIWTDFSQRNGAAMVGKTIGTSWSSKGLKWFTGWWYTYPSEKWWSSSVGMMKFPIYYGNIKNVPNHQPEYVFQALLQRISIHRVWPRHTLLVPEATTCVVEVLRTQVASAPKSKIQNLMFPRFLWHFCRRWIIWRYPKFHIVYIISFYIPLYLLITYPDKKRLPVTLQYINCSK